MLCSEVPLRQAYSVITKEPRNSVFFEKRHVIFISCMITANFNLPVLMMRIHGIVNPKELFIFVISHDFSGHQTVFLRNVLFRLIINWILAPNKGNG